MRAFLKVKCIPSFLLNLCLEWEFTSSALVADSSGCLVLCPLIMVRPGTRSQSYKMLSGLIKLFNVVLKFNSRCVGICFVLFRRLEVIR